MSQSKIYNKLEELYKKDEKSKNFVLHLVRAYLPLDKVDKVWDKPQDLKKFKCALSDAKLISVAEVFEGMQSDDFQKNFIQSLKIMVGENQEKIESPMAKILNGRILGWTGKDTNTYLCDEAVSELFNWVSTKILQGDGKINWTMRQMRANQFLGKFDGFKDDETKKQVKRIKQVVNKPATAKLGDLDVLQSLKDKLAAEEKKK